MRRTRAALALLSLLPALVAVSPPASAALPGAPPSDLFLEWLAAREPRGSSAGDVVRYGLDPETGEWGYPGRGAIWPGAIAETEDRSVLVRMPDGSIVVYPDPRLVTDFAVVRADPDGALHWDCAPPADGAPWLARPADPRWTLRRPAGAPPDR